MSTYVLTFNWLVAKHMALLQEQRINQNYRTDNISAALESADVFTSQNMNSYTSHEATF